MQQQFSDDGILVIHIAKRFSPKVEIAILELLKDLPTYEVCESDAIEQNNWGVIYRDKSYLIEPRTEPAKRLLARFWDGHQKSALSKRSDNLFFDFDVISKMTELFKILGGKTKILQENGILIFSSFHFKAYIGPNKVIENGNGKENNIGHNENERARKTDRPRPRQDYRKRGNRAIQNLFSRTHKTPEKSRGKKKHKNL